MSTEIICSKCGSMFNKRILFIHHRRLCGVSKAELSVVHNDESNNSNDMSNISTVTEEQPDSPVDLSNEEYLEEDEMIAEHYDSQFEAGNEHESSIDEIPLQYEIKLEPNTDEKPFLCTYCEKTFMTRSGRDTHQQLKHKIPDEFDQNVEEHELEIVLETGELIRAWKCPFCELVSRRKNHHQTHLIRHAIRDKEETIKQETQEKSIVIAGTQSLENPNSKVDQETITIELSPEHAPKRESLGTAVIPSLSKKPRTTECFAVSNKSNVGAEHFSCSVCESKFHDEDSANSHVIKYGSNDLCISCVCAVCNVAFLSEKLFKRHQSYHSLAPIADKLNYYECSTCSVVFNCKKDMDSHIEIHSAENYKYEPENTTQLDGCELLIKDLDVEWNRKALHCAYCIKFGTKNEINLHMALFHGHLVCPFDKQDFSRSLGYFVDHMKTKHAEQFGAAVLSFKCPHCTVQEFPTKSQMMEHCKTCQAKAFPCNHCTKVFALERQLKHHLILVNGVKNHKCNFCEKLYANRTELNVHIRSHTNFKPYSCSFPECDKAFRTNSHRSAHMDTHNPNKNFECLTCSAKFQTRGARRIHEKSHSLVLNTCGICLKDFKQRSHYVRHVNDLHHIQCNSYNLEEILQNHIKKKELIGTPSDESNQ